MLRTNFVRRAGRLLGAVTVVGVLSAGVLTTVPAAAQPVAKVAHINAASANGLNFSARQHYRVQFYEANGI